MVSRCDSDSNAGESVMVFGLFSLDITIWLNDTSLSLIVVNGTVKRQNTWANC